MRTFAATLAPKLERLVAGAFAPTFVLACALSLALDLAPTSDAMAAPTLAPAAAPADPAAASPPPTVGLVLGGGGARGAAHIGVLEVLEQAHVPIACVAGTSMGALVAGAWAAGLDPATMRRELAATDWNDLFQDSPAYKELSLRAKHLNQQFLSATEVGIDAGGAETPPGVITGQKVKLLFNRLLRADTGTREIEHLALPLSIVATDIGNGRRVVFRSGSLAQAMRASMSVPGLVAPLDYDGHKLVDGGLVDNLPVREVRDLCHPDVVIAVDVSSPLLPAADVGSLFSISAQVVAILTSQNVNQSLAALRPQDILIRPALDGIGPTDFAANAEAADRGHAAAEALLARLAPLAATPADYAAWRARFDARRAPPPRIDAIRITGLQRVNPQAVSRYVRQRVGAPLNTAQLDEDLQRIYGDGDYQGVDYSLLNERGREILRIAPVEKSWGPDYLRLAGHLDSNLSQGSTYELRAGYQRTWINHLGGELLFTGEIGSETGAGADWYQPLDGIQRWFGSAKASYRRSRRDVFEDDQRIAEYTVGNASVEFGAGANLGLAGQIRTGWRDTHWSGTLDTGVPALPTESAHFGGWFGRIEFDRLDQQYFPTRGWAADASWFDSSQKGYGKLELGLRGSWSLGPWVLGARASWVGSTHGALPVYDAGLLGGFLNLSGFAKGQLVGDHVAYAGLRAERIIGSLPLGLRGDMRLGLAFEEGRVRLPYAETHRTGWLDSGTLYLGGDTPIGPVYLGLGHSASGAT
ncbi:MAG: patatin-like phospholipase family protein, partial [Burkholderiales bacterium]|nr:patatin-like phospholipase family protein [Burkholderiales bacterium]